MRTRLDRDWLERIIAVELDRHDPVAALALLPPDVRSAGGAGAELGAAARLLVARSLRHRRPDGEPKASGDGSTSRFLEDVRVHVSLLLDLAALQGGAFERHRRRAEIASFLAAAMGETDVALAVPLAGTGHAARSAERAVARAIAAAAIALSARFLPHGDPVQGLPLHPGHLALVRRRVARTASAYHRRGLLERAALDRHAAHAEREAALLAEVLAGLLVAAGRAGARVLPLRLRQLARLGLGRAALREAKAAVSAPRGPAELAAAAPPRMRPFLAEQLFLAVLDGELLGEGPRRFVEAFVASAGLDATTLATAQVEAAAQHGGHQAWFEPADTGSPIMSQGLVGDFEGATDLIVERVSSAVTGNLESLVTEIRETGELGHLLARAAAGATLSAEEKRKVRAQLIDLAKAVPALAIFAAPGGMLLLPLIAKLLPFNLLPSAWDRGGEPRKGAAAPREDAPAGGAAGDAPPKAERTG